MAEVSRINALNSPRLRPGDEGYLGWTAGKWYFLRVFNANVDDKEAVASMVRQVSFLRP